MQAVLRLRTLRGGGISFLAAHSSFVLPDDVCDELLAAAPAV